MVFKVIAVAGKNESLGLMYTVDCEFVYLTPFVCLKMHKVVICH